jgi:pantothenate kinase-related protein Tda10
MKPFFILIDGPMGSGKTTLATRVEMGLATNATVVYTSVI